MPWMLESSGCPGESRSSMAVRSRAQTPSATGRPLNDTVVDTPGLVDHEEIDGDTAVVPCFESYGVQTTLAPLQAASRSSGSQRNGSQIPDVLSAFT
jgi:hypothetical protein